MKNFDRSDLSFSLCGLNCGLCPMKLDRYCPGCGGGDGNQSCPIARCSLERGGFAYCFQCEEFPCARYTQTDTYDTFLSKCNRMRDIERFRRIGQDAYHAEQADRIAVLNRLLENYNDGRRKSLFCLAAQLLEPQSLAAVLRQLDAETAGLPQQEKAIRATDLLRALAEEQNIVLKLHKKPSKKKTNP